MSLSNSAESDLLLLIFNNTNWANVGDATGLRGSSTAGSLYMALHTATLGETAVQNTSEAAYTSYARTAIARTSGGWTVSGTAPTQAANAAVVSAPKATGGSETETDFTIGVASSGATEVLWYGALTSSLAVSTNVQPTFSIGALVCNID
jgi:hypothetical protein